MRIRRGLLILAISSGLAAVFAPRSLGVDLIGYVPDYRMNDSSYVNNVLSAQLAMLDEVRYFGITVTASGGLTTAPANLAHIQTIQQKISALPQEKRPRLGITLGGANLSANFAAVAQSASLRTTLAQNINSLLTQTGTVGVDIDWEHPETGEDLTTHYPAMLSRIKQEIGVSRRLYATVAPSKMLPRSVFEGANAVDGVSIMTYALNWWNNSPHYDNLGEHSLHQYVVDSIAAWTNPAGFAIPQWWIFGSQRSIDAPEDRLGVGSPFYAGGYAGTNPESAVAYRSLSTPWTTTDGNGYQSGSQKVWLPSKELLADRITYAEQRRLQHVIFWELWQDLPTTNPNSLLRTAFETRAALTGDFTADGVTDEADVAAWQQHFGAQTGVTGPMGDADNNNTIDGRDFLIWQRHANFPAAAHAVPEPLALGLAALAVILLAPWRRGARLNSDPWRCRPSL